MIGLILEVRSQNSLEGGCHGRNFHGRRLCVAWDCRFSHLQKALWGISFWRYQQGWKVLVVKISSIAWLQLDVDGGRQTFVGINPRSTSHRREHFLPHSKVFFREQNVCWRQIKLPDHKFSGFPSGTRFFMNIGYVMCVLIIRVIKSWRFCFLSSSIRFLERG